MPRPPCRDAPPPRVDDGAAPTRGPEPARYANQFAVGHNAFEFVFDFAQDYDTPDGAPLTPTRIVTVPAYAKVFCGLLAQSIRQYEAAFGPIPQSAGETDTETGPGDNAPEG